MQLFEATSDPATDGVALAKPSRLIPECSVLMGFMYDLTGMVSDARAAVPNVVKIDTEGFELDVLQGMGTVLAEPALRGVFVEVHFGLLADRGMADAPSTIEALLRAAGFETTWVDPSHIAGTRPKAA